MIRLLGILSGALIAVAALILLVGLPEFPAKREQASPMAAEREATAAPGDVDESRPDTSAKTAGAAPLTQNLAEAAAATIEDPAVSKPVTATPQPEHWHAFWSPFRSELAANGFVAQLQRTTGLDYRVVKLKPGVYEVAFSYSDATDIETKLAQISAATGLDIPEG